MANSYEPDDVTKLFSETDILEMIHQEVDAAQAAAAQEALEQEAAPGVASAQDAAPELVEQVPAPLPEEPPANPVVDDVPAQAAVEPTFPEVEAGIAYPESDELAGLGNPGDGLEEPVTVIEQTVIFPERSPSFDEEHGTHIGERYENEYGRFDIAQVNPNAVVESPISHVGESDGGGYVVPGEGKSRSKLRPLLALLLVGILAAGIAAAGTYGLELWGGKHPPNVVGLSETKATQALEAKGFEVDTRTRIAADGIGFVLEQTPTSDERVDAGSSVTIVVAANRMMPEVVGLKREEAEELLTKAGAGEIKVELKNSDSEEGTVISVSPEPGQPFTAHQVIEMVVSQKPVVPDVMGKTKAEATALVEDAGFKVKAVNSPSEDKTPGTVIKQEPEAESKLNPGDTVTLTIAEQPMGDPLHLIDYLTTNPKTIATFLPKQGFSRAASHEDGSGYAEVAYVSTGKGRLIFKTQPFTHDFDSYPDSGKDLLKEGMRFVGVRWEVPPSMMPAGASSLSEAAAQELMKTCGLDNQLGISTEETIVVPEDVVKNDSKFVIISGDYSGATWTVLIVNESQGTRAVVTVAPIELYEDYYDIEPYGNKVRNLVAAADVYSE